MNVIKIMGGLGNQLFQYTFGQVQAENGIEVAYDRSWFSTARKPDTPRPYLLDKFDIEIKDSPFLSQQTIHETEWDDTMFMITNCNFFGYWQYVDYYQGILKLLRERLVVRDTYYTPEYRSLVKQLVNGQITAVHVRRGDYLTTRGFKTVPMAYYFEALKQVKGDVFLFSDDLEWCKKIFKPDYFKRSFTFINLPDYLAWDIMRQCDNQITANSSFSITAAMMNVNADKVVITPKQVCLEHRVEQEKLEHLPKEWIIL